MAMKRNLSNEISEKHWDFVRRVSEHVSHWPAWKKEQFRTIIGEPQAEECQRSDSHSGTDSKGREAVAARERQIA